MALGEADSRGKLIDPALHSRGWTFPKMELVSALQVAFQARQLRIARGLAQAATLVRELQDFRVRPTATRRPHPVRHGNVGDLCRLCSSNRTWQVDTIQARPVRSAWLPRSLLHDSRL
jgi:hypothetical protein